MQGDTSVTSSCTRPLPLLGTGVPPSFPVGRQARWRCAWRGPSTGCRVAPLSPRTIVGKSRTTGSHYLTSVSSTIAKHGGRRAAAAERRAGELRGPRGLQRPPPMLRKRQRPGELAGPLVQDSGAGGTPHRERTRSCPSVLPDGSSAAPCVGTVLAGREGTHWQHLSAPRTQLRTRPVPTCSQGDPRGYLHSTWSSAWTLDARGEIAQVGHALPLVSTPCHCLI